MRETLLQRAAPQRAVVAPRNVVRRQRNARRTLPRDLRRRSSTRPITRIAALSRPVNRPVMRDTRRLRVASPRGRCALKNVVATAAAEHLQVIAAQWVVKISPSRKTMHLSRVRERKIAGRCSRRACSMQCCEATARSRAAELATSARKRLPIVIATCFDACRARQATACATKRAATNRSSRQR